MPFTSDTVFDGFLELRGGINSGWQPSQLPNDSLSFAWNCTVRGGYVTHRPGKTLIPLVFDNDVVRKRVVEGKFQGAYFYQPDDANGYPVASISGRLFKFTVTDDTSQVTEITINESTLTTADFVIPTITQTVVVQVVSTQNISTNAPIQIGNYNYTVDSIDSDTQLTLVNVDGPAGDTQLSGTQLTFWDVNPALRNQVWMEQAEKWLIIQDGQSLPIFWDGAKSKRSVPTLGQMTAGKMMQYHRGRVAKVNPDGYTYSIGDIVYGSSGTPSEKFRDSLLYVKENDWLVGGGFFTVPGVYGQIQFMRDMADLNVALGQGPLMLGAEKAVFSVNLPKTRDDWAKVEDPLQAVAHIANGGVSQNASINVNADLFYRTLEGVRTLAISQREFANQWGNTPVSREMNRVLPYDDPTLLQYSSAVYFDNRMLVTTSPSYSARGVFFRGSSIMDFDVLSSIRGKEPAVWEGVWTGVNTLQYIVGKTNKKSRCFEFITTGTGDIELWEQTTDSKVDKVNYPIKWVFETADFFRKSQQFHELDMKRLINGELYITDLVGTANFRVWWKPDQHPCWEYWTSFSQCANASDCDETGDCVEKTVNQPQYRHRLPFGQPPDTCDSVDKRKRLREGRTFQLRIQVIGSCKIRGLRLMANTIKEPAMEDMSKVCST
jgi:hypothetical protein